MTVRTKHNVKLREDWAASSDPLLVGEIAEATRYAQARARRTGRRQSVWRATGGSNAGMYLVGEPRDPSIYKLATHIHPPDVRVTKNAIYAARTREFKWKKVTPAVARQILDGEGPDDIEELDVVPSNYGTALDGTKRSWKDLQVLIARMRHGLPIWNWLTGPASCSQLYDHHRLFFEDRSERVSGPWLALYEELCSGAPRSNPKANPKRRRNTHDPQASGRYARSATQAAAKQLALAEKEWKPKDGQKSLEHLLSASYYIGRARVEAQYAGGYLDEDERRSIHVLEQAMDGWAKEFVSAR